MVPTSTRDLSDPGSIDRRIRLTDFRMDAAGESGCEARVVVQWSEDKPFVGEAKGESTNAGQLRCAAEATARALVEASQGKVNLEVIAVKAVEGFDTVIVVVSLASRLGDLAERLVGSCLIQGEAPRGAVLAVLNATNRLFGRVVHDEYSPSTPDEK